MDIATIHVTRRQGLGTRAARGLRRQGAVPAVLYGRQRDTVHLAVPLKEIESAVAAGSRMVNLEIGGTMETALLKDVQYDAMGDQLIHVDLTRVAMDEKVTVTVPVELHGLAKGVASGGVLDHLIRDIEVTCLPRDIPEKIRVEIADLDIDQIVHVRDLVPPQGVEFGLEPDTPVVTVHPPVEAQEPEAVEAAGEPAEPEVIGRRAAAEGEDAEDHEE